MLEGFWRYLTRGRLVAGSISKLKRASRISRMESSLLNAPMKIAEPRFKSASVVADWVRMRKSLPWADRTGVSMASAMASLVDIRSSAGRPLSSFWEREATTSSAGPGESQTGAQNCSKGSCETQGFSQNVRLNTAMTPIAAAAYMAARREGAGEMVSTAATGAGPNSGT